MYEVDRAYPIPIGPIFNMAGDFVGLGYASSRNSNDILVKSPFNENYLISDIAPLMDRGYQFSTNVCTLPGCPGTGTWEEFRWKNF